MTMPAHVVNELSCTGKKSLLIDYNSLLNRTGFITEFCRTGLRNELHGVELTRALLVILSLPMALCVLFLFAGWSVCLSARITRKVMGQFV